MLLHDLNRNAIQPLFALLPVKMSTRAAQQMLLTIAMQESGARHRRQAGGPARGYWQFEHGGGVIGVLKHPATAEWASMACAVLDYPAESVYVYQAIEHNDILAAAFARLLLWTLPAPLAADQDAGWSQYIDAWRPGKPHPDKWPRCWAAAAQYLDAVDAAA